MTAAEKTTLAQFLDLAGAYCKGGFRSRQQDYQFTDDVQPDSTSAASGNAATDSLECIAGDIKTCEACELCTTRKNAVPGEGAHQPLVMVIGEGPGADEDATGRPFVGKAGQLLDKMLAAIGLSRENNCFIANVIKCRPPGNRDPQPAETAACAAFLKRQIAILEPRFILSAGRVSVQTLLSTGEPIGKLRGKFIDFPAADRVIPLIATYHPSALLRNEDLKRPAWEDLKLLRTAITEADLGDRLLQ
ncbi:MAG: uracil-DNA glycosylase [Treponema sp.]|nr:uracil-DNA glycosylase [Treponema sp.]